MILSPFEYRKLSLTERAKLLPPPSDDRMAEIYKYQERMGYTDEDIMSMLYKMSVFDDFNDEYDARVKYTREHPLQEQTREQEGQEIMILFRRRG